MAKLKEPAAPGALCTPDQRGATIAVPHVIEDPAIDVELQQVYQWLCDHEPKSVFRVAVDDAIKYVLEGQRTRRFSLMESSVDSDERASVGTKLQYRLIEGLGLEKVPPLDTNILGVAVEIKGTVRSTWMIPREGQCEVTILVRVDAMKHEFEAKLMRMHRGWLNDGGNQDKKRTPSKLAVNRFALQLLPPTALPSEPLRSLTSEQLDIVLGDGGLRSRYVELFTILSEVVVPRGTLLIVGSRYGDPMKRAREAKAELRRRGLVVLVGTWTEQRLIAEQLGFDLSDEAWVAVHVGTFAAHGMNVPAL